MSAGDAYNCDITYITNNELGFDYLRDNMVIYKEQLVQRGLHYAIIDEVDSVLIDEARTPLIISGQSGKSTKLYEACDILAQQLTRGEDVPEYSKMDAIMGIEQEETGDFIVNEKDKLVNLTQQGVEKVEKFFHTDNCCVRFTSLSFFIFDKVSGFFLLNSHDGILLEYSGTSPHHVSAAALKYHMPHIIWWTYP